MDALVEGAAPPRKAAWWCWPLIGLSLLPFSWLVGWLPQEDASPPEVVEVGEANAAAELALLKLQGQVLIASSKVDPSSTQKALKDLSRTVSGDRQVAAFALLESFVGPASLSAATTLERLSPTVSRELAETTARALSEGLDEAGRDRLRRHLGWFAELARGPGLSPPPHDGAIRARAIFVFGVMALAIMGGSCGILAGAVLLVLHLRRTSPEGSAPNAFDPTRHRDGVFLECFALYLGIMTAGALLGEFLHMSIGIVAYGLAVVLPLLWPKARGMGWGEFRAGVGLHRGTGWRREIGAGAVGYLGVLAIASIGVALTVALTIAAEAFASAAPTEGGGGGTQATPGPDVHPVVGWIYEGSLWTKLASFALAAGFAPVFEELFFRGALHRHFRGRFRFLPSALFSGLIFAALHPQGAFAIPALAGIGIGFALLREWRDSLIAPMVAHAINNGCLVGMLWWLL